jgi:hypothetical protein
MCIGAQYLTKRRQRHKKQFEMGRSWKKPNNEFLIQATDINAQIFATVLNKIIEDGQMRSV